MTTKFQIVAGLTGQNVSAIFIRQETGQFWNGAALEDFSGANIANYAVSTAEKGTIRNYEGTVPEDLPAGNYTIIGYYRAGASLAQDDQLAGTAELRDWAGVSTAGVVGSPLGTMLGSAFYQFLVRSGLVRDDLEQECYDELTNTVLEIDQLLEADERQVERTITDTISVLGDYKMAVESDMGYVLGVTLIDGNFSRPLNKVSKREFDEKYPDPENDVATGRPVDFCLFGGEILVGPRPDSTSYAYRKDFTKRLTSAIDADTDIPYSAQYREVLKDGVLFRIFENLKHWDTADRYAAKYQAGLARIATKEDRNHSAPGCVAYQDH